jgi:hypothetical protein
LNQAENSGLTPSNWTSPLPPEITDAELNDLKTLKNLRLLHLGSTSVTDGGLKKLKGSLPNVEIARWEKTKASGIE